MQAFLDDLPFTFGRDGLDTAKPTVRPFLETAAELTDEELLAVSVGKQAAGS